jgi:transcriptional regulator with XRE-family HTH domain
MAKQQETFGRRLRRLRQAADLTQQQLATAAGLATSVVVVLESGKPQASGKPLDPRLSTLTALAKALGCDVRELIGGNNR